MGHDRFDGKGMSCHRVGGISIRRMGYGTRARERRSLYGSVYFRFSATFEHTDILDSARDLLTAKQSIAPQRNAMLFLHTQRPQHVLGR